MEKTKEERMWNMSRIVTFIVFPFWPGDQVNRKNCRSKYGWHVVLYFVVEKGIQFGLDNLSALFHFGSTNEEKRNLRHDFLQCSHAVL